MGEILRLDIQIGKQFFMYRVEGVLIIHFVKKKIVYKKGCKKSIYDFFKKIYFLVHLMIIKIWIFPVCIYLNFDLKIPETEGPTIQLSIYKTN